MLNIFIVCGFGLHAQDIGSITSLPIPKSDIVDSLSDAAFIHLSSNPKWSSEALDRALEIALDIDYREGESHVYELQAVTYRMNGLYARAIEHHLKALKIAEELNFTKGIANNTGNIGMVYAE